MLTSLTDSRGVGRYSPSWDRTRTLLLQRNTGRLTATDSSPRNTPDSPSVAGFGTDSPRVRHGSKGHSCSGFHQSFHHVSARYFPSSGVSRCGSCGGPLDGVHCDFCGYSWVRQ